MEDSKELAFDLAASYRIRIRGLLEDHWTDRLGGMKITRQDQPGEVPITTLSGKLLDQSALIGVLNTLYELHYPLISVEFLSK